MQKKGIIYLLAFLKFAIPFFLQNPIYEPHRDEFLYLAEGHHMAWGYMEVPPLLSVFAWLTHLLGDGMFWIKCWSSLFGAFTYIIVANIILSLGGRIFALILAWIPFIIGSYLRVHFLFQPNFLEIFFYTLIAYAAVRYIQTHANKWIYLLGIATALGMLSKYSVAFYLTGILLGLLLSPERKIFLNKHLYLAFAVGFILFLPNLIWQWSKDFPVFYHMHALQHSQLQYIRPSDFLLDQFRMNLAGIFIWIGGLAFILFSGQGRKYLPLAWAYFIVIILLLLGHGKNYYALGLYPTLFGFGAFAMEKISSLRFKWLRVVMILFPLLFLRLFVALNLPLFAPARLDAFYQRIGAVKYGSLKWEDQENHPLPQDFSDMLGWKEMTQKMAKAYNLLDSNEKKNCTLFCDNYGMAGALNYYGPQYGLPKAYSDNASFVYWMPDSIQIKNLLLVTDDQEEMTHAFVKDFQFARVVDSVTSPYARERGDLIILFKGANQQFAAYFRRKMERKKAELLGKPLSGSLNE